MSLGLVVLEKKLFTRTRTPTPQSDDIMSADIKIASEMPVPHRPQPKEIDFNTMRYRSNEIVHRIENFN